MPFRVLSELNYSGNLLLTLFTWMTSSSIPGVTKEAVTYVQKRLLLDLSDDEAAAKFSHLINKYMLLTLIQLNFAQLCRSERTRCPSSPRGSGWRLRASICWISFPAMWWYGLKHLDRRLHEGVKKNYNSSLLSRRYFWENLYLESC